MGRMQPKKKACSFGDDKKTTRARAVRSPRQRRNTKLHSKQKRPMPRRIDDEVVDRIVAHLRAKKKAGERPEAASVVEDLGLAVSVTFIREIARGIKVRLSVGGRPKGSLDSRPRARTEERRKQIADLLQANKTATEPLTMEQIAAKVGISRAALYRYLSDGATRKKN